MKNLIITIATCIGITAAPIVFFNPDTRVVTGYLRRANTPDYLGRNDVVIITNKLTQIPTNWTTVPLKFWKVSETNTLVEFTQEEKNAVLNAELAAAEESLRSGAKSGFNATDSAALIDRAIVVLTVQQLNLLRDELNQAKTNYNAWRAEPVLPRITLNQAKNAIENIIDQKLAD